MARWAAVQVALTILLLLALEGAASIRAALRKAAPRGATEPIVAERLHTEYDSLLGWINRPNVRFADFYGPRRHLRINAHRFRAHDHADPLATSTLARLVVSGDSFTFGYGVGDQDSWVAQLDRSAPRMEVVNMGLGGFGLDQAFLWYQRDGQHLPHNLHLFAFITENYNRMGRDTFMGHGKPVLTARDGRLNVGNVPPPRPRAGARTTHRWIQAFHNLHLAQALTSRIRPPHRNPPSSRGSNVQATARLIFAELHRLHRATGRRGALVHLPIEKDYRDAASSGWRHWLREEADREGWLFVDLVVEMRKLPAGEIPRLFIQSDDGRYRGAKGHYTEAGNAFIKDALHRNLMQHPDWAVHLASTP